MDTEAETVEIWRAAERDPEMVHEWREPAGSPVAIGAQGAALNGAASDASGLVTLERLPYVRQ